MAKWQNKIFLFIIWAAVVPGVMAQEMTLDKLLENYYRAGNFGKLGAVKTVIMTGSIVQQDLMPVKIIRMRPDKYLMEYDVADMTAYLGYDGDTAWLTAPWTGNADPQVAPAERTTDLKVRADLDGVLVDASEKGHKLELSGTDTLDGAILYKIKVTRKDGGVEYDCIDAGTFRLVKRITTRQMRGQEVRVENYYRDYREVEGIPFAFTVETRYPNFSTEMQFDSLLIDRPVDPKVFEMPGKQ
jgi:hypothetical protein